MKIAGFDIETARPAPNDDSVQYDIGITCAAIATNGKDEIPYVKTPKRYYDIGRFHPEMGWREIGQFIQALCEIRAQGYAIASINGLGFDFRVLAEECGSDEQYANVVDLALNHYDPGFQMLCQKGWMQGLAGFAAGCKIEGKTEGMDGLKAIEMWKETPGNQEKVVEYVRQDARATAQILDCFDQNKVIRWVSKRGYPGQYQIEKLLTVKECLELPLPVPPKWVKVPWPREKFAGWLLKSVEV